MDLAAAVGAPMILAPASTASDCVPERVPGDLAWLADEAAARGLRVAYEAMAWSTVNARVEDAWGLVQRLGRDNLGLVLDAFHLFAPGGAPPDLDDIPADRVYLVQLSDLAAGPTSGESLADVARHRRVLPGEGNFPLSRLRDWARRAGYRGPVGLEVFNDDWRARDPREAAHAAMRSLRAAWPD